MSKEKRTKILNRIDRIEQQLDNWGNYKIVDPQRIERLSKEKERLYDILWHDEL